MNLFFASNVAYDPNLTLCPGMPDCWTHITLQAFWVNIL